MIRSKTRIATLAAAALAAGLALSAASAQARTAEEDTHCLALGMAFSSFGDLEKEVSKTLRDSLTADASAEDKATIDQLDELGEQATQVGAALQRNFASAARPSEAEVKALDDLTMDELIEQANKCVD